jgi:microcystin-dependent protein
MAKRWSAGDKVNASDLNNSVVPTGAIIPFAGAAAPTDWLLCDGASLLRASYADLFALIGTTYGSADGTHFNLPNLKGKIPVGLNASDTEFDTLGETGGEKTHTLTATEMPAHSHNTTHYNLGSGAGTNPTSQNGNTYPSVIASESAGSDTAHNNLQPYLVVNYIIKS